MIFLFSAKHVEVREETAADSSRLICDTGGMGIGQKNSPNLIPENDFEGVDDVYGECGSVLY